MSTDSQITFKMHILLIVITTLLLQASALPADVGYDTTVQHFDCGTTKANASQDLIDKHSELHNQTLKFRRREGTWKGSAAGKASDMLSKRTYSITVPVYFHVVTGEDSSSKALVTQGMATAQIQAMNNAYRPTGFSFNLQGTDFHANNSWATGDDPNMQSALRKGGYGALNIYFLTNVTGGVLGQCSMPTNVGGNPAPAQFSTDGCIIHAGTMPGAPSGFSLYGYSEGMTAVHETGHWLGLFHPFEGNSCDPSQSGDYIADTPVQSTATNGCPASKDSCPSQPGSDSIHNYMDYSTDACYTSFTDDQISRMQSFWPEYRQKFATA
jgi:pregnancy-associated plasma protein-A